MRKFGLDWWVGWFDLHMSMYTCTCTSRGIDLNWRSRPVSREVERSGEVVEYCCITTLVRSDELGRVWFGWLSLRGLGCFMIAMWIL